MTDRKPIVEKTGEQQALQPTDRLDTTFTNDRLPQRTGVIKGWVPSIASATTVDITAGIGFLVDNETNPLLPTFVLQNSGPYAGVTVLNVATQNFTFFHVDSAGVLQQQNSAPTRSEMRTKQFISVTYQLAGIVISTYPMGAPAFEGDLFSHDFQSEIVTSGNFFDKATAGGLQMQVSAGTMGYSNANRQDTVASRRDPHFVAQSGEDPVTWTYVNNDGFDNISITALNETEIDTIFRSDGIGGLVAVANNRSSLQVIYREPKGNVVVEYTVAEFNPSQTTAEEALTDAINQQPLVITFPFDAIYVLEIPVGALDLDNCIFHRVDFSTAIGGSIGGDDPLTRRIASEDKSTGIINGGLLTVNGGNPAGLDISDGDGWSVDSYSTDESIVTSVTWTGLTNITITDIATQNSTFFALDKAQPVPNIIQQATDFTVVQFRDLIVLGRVLHTDNATITDFVPAHIPTYDILLTVVDFLQSFGPFNLSGNVYSSTGANLIPQKSAGSSFKVGGNYQVDKKDPNRTTDPADVGLTFGYLFRDPGSPDGFNIIIPQTAFNPNIYDFGDGTTPAVPNNRWTFQTLFFFPQVNTHRFHLGQATYQFKQDAIDAITADPITSDPFLNSAIRRGWLVVQEGTTDLTDPAMAVFLEASDIAFGGGGGGPTDLNSLSDVTITAPADGNVLSFDGTDWENLRSPVTYVFQATQNVAPGTNVLLELTTQSEFIPIKVDARIKTVDPGVDLVMDINNSGSTLLTGALTISATASTGTVTTLIPTLAIGQVLTVDIDSGGSAWAGLTIEVTGYTIPN